MRKIFLSFLLLTSGTVFCQDNFKKGYVVNNNGDTVRGYIKQDIEAVILKSINFKDQGGVSRSLSTGDIKGFGFDGESKFRLVSYVDPLDSFKRKTHFAKLLFQGSYELFFFRRKNNEDYLYFVAANKDTSYLLYDDKRSALGDVLENGNYRSQLFLISQECPSTSSSTIYLWFSERALMSFFISFEKCKGNLQNTINYYSKSKSEFRFALVAGGFHLGHRSEISVQALAEFIAPSLSRKTSLNTGLVYLQYSNKFTRTVTSTLYTRTTNYHEVTEIFEIPLLLRYKILEKAIQPYVYAGPGIALKKEKGSAEQVAEATDQTWGVTLIAGAGIDARVLKNLFLRVEWRYDLLAHLPIVALAYKL